MSTKLIIEIDMGSLNSNYDPKESLGQILVKLGRKLFDEGIYFPQEIWDIKGEKMVKVGILRIEEPVDR